MFGKTIKLFLIDGEPNGRMTCELSNWTGKAYKIPRIKVKDCTDREELNDPGIYLLFGKEEEGKDLVYIGEAESAFKRLVQQLSQKEFWNEAIVFISKDENLNKAHIKYLENRLYSMAQEINRYALVNNSTPSKPTISEADQAEMEEFIANIKILTNTLGHKVFESKREARPLDDQVGNYFYIDAARGAKASGEPTSDGFVIFEGSKVANSEVNSLPSSSKRLRDKLKDEGIIKENEVAEDYLASSPSAAAMIVMGRSANGLVEWKLKDGTTLKEYESAE